MYNIMCMKKYFTCLVFPLLLFGNSKAQVSLVYNLDNWLHTHTIQYWDTASGSWLNSREYEQTHTLDSLVSIRQYKYWNPDSSKWNIIDESHFAYDSNSRISGAVCYINTNSASILDSRFSIYYNLSGQFDSINFQHYDTTATTWKNKKRDRYYYNNEGLADTVYFDGVDALYQWKLSSRGAYTFDSLNRTTSFGGMSFSVSLNQWINDNHTRHLLYYDSLGFLNQEIEQGWNTVSLSWFDEMIYYYTPNQSGLRERDSSVHLFLGDTTNTQLSVYEYYPSGKIFRITYSFWRNQSWLLYSREIFNYIDEPVLTGIAPLKEGNNQIFVSPNPNSGDFFIRYNSNDIGLAEIEIFDLNGKREMLLYQSSEIGDNRVRINSSNLQAGIYIGTVRKDSVRYFFRVIHF